MLKWLRSISCFNVMGRTLIRLFIRNTGKGYALANRFRVHGNIPLTIEGHTFKMYAEADDFIINEMYYGMNYERKEFRLLNFLLPQSSNFIDVGANTGVFTIFAAKVNPNLKVLAIEPHPGNFRRLIRNVALNQVNVSFSESAIGSYEGMISFNLPSDESLSTTSSANLEFVSNFSTAQLKTIQVNQHTLNDMLKAIAISERDLLKIDVEYYELEVLLGCSEIISKKKPMILIEILNYENLVSQFPKLAERINPDHGNQIESLLISEGYYSYQLLDEGIKRLDSVSVRQDLRNFLFIPFLTDEFITYTDFERVFKNRK